MTRILIVDDEPDIREVIRFALEGVGFHTTEAQNADEALGQIRSNSPDLVLLDWMLPGRSGVDLAKYLKRDPDSRDLPIVMLTARTAESDLVQGLDAGADDYVTKPFSPRELVARIHAVLRRTQVPLDEEICVKGLCLDPMSQRVSARDKTLEITPTEYKLLQFFMGHRERVFTRSQLLDQVWGQDAYVEERTVDVHIRRLRKILEPTGHDDLIQTVRGSGYRFSARR